MKFPIAITFDENNKKDAFRPALQSAVAAIIAFVIMKSLGLPEVFLCVLSAVLIVEPSIGNTISQAERSYSGYYCWKYYWLWYYRPNSI
ncbi:hypothetical protein N7U66_00105 [Lacinutrix neustonica]|uniref:Uncharacterized protein n=1 Tax=Lacinutrix neustonica TaxID=2980107 RepID=A0A9E8MVA8_9FLAO|nr:hypothetical protein [Lacinutrix neustonica]WAC02233.1 hypothetical protein N7U66_00105 [Lacinutrix neustonica]